MTLRGRYAVAIQFLLSPACEGERAASEAGAAAVDQVQAAPAADGNAADRPVAGGPPRRAADSGRAGGPDGRRADRRRAQCRGGDRHRAGPGPGGRRHRPAAPAGQPARGRAADRGDLARAGGRAAGAAVWRCGRAARRCVGAGPGCRPGPGVQPGRRAADGFHRGRPRGAESAGRHRRRPRRRGLDRRYRSPPRAQALAGRRDPGRECPGRDRGASAEQAGSGRRHPVWRRAGSRSGQ